MNNGLDLPADVIAAIQAKRKIEAIRLLREQRRIDLKDAKEMVEAYMDAHPRAADGRHTYNDSNAGRLVLIAIVLAVIYAAYRYMH